MPGIQPREYYFSSNFSPYSNSFRKEKGIIFPEVIRKKQEKVVGDGIFSNFAKKISRFWTTKAMPLLRKIAPHAKKFAQTQGPKLIESGVNLGVKELEKNNTEGSRIGALALQTAGNVGSRFVQDLDTNTQNKAKVREFFTKEARNVAKTGLDEVQKNQIPKIKNNTIKDLLASGADLAQAGISGSGLRNLEKTPEQIMKQKMRKRKPRSRKY